MTTAVAVAFAAIHGDGGSIRSSKSTLKTKSGAADTAHSRKSVVNKARTPLKERFKVTVVLDCCPRILAVTTRAIGLFRMDN